MSSPNEQPNPDQPTQNQSQPTNAPEQQQQQQQHENGSLSQGAPTPTGSASASVITPAPAPAATEVAAPVPAPVATALAAPVSSAVPTLPTAPAPVEAIRPTGAFTIYVKTLTGKTITMEQFADNNVEVDDVKAELEKSEGVAKTQMTLIFGGKTMKDDDTLAKHNVKDKNTLHLVLQLRGGAEC